jgi:hypothetical protein
MNHYRESLDEACSGSAPRLPEGTQLIAHTAPVNAGIQPVPMLGTRDLQLPQHRARPLVRVGIDQERPESR